MLPSAPMRENWRQRPPPRPCLNRWPIHSARPRSRVTSCMGCTAGRTCLTSQELRNAASKTWAHHQAKLSLITCSLLHVWTAACRVIAKRRPRAERPATSYFSTSCRICGMAAWAGLKRSSLREGSTALSMVATGHGRCQQRYCL